jgi:hypothetical protein
MDKYLRLTEARESQEATRMMEGDPCMVSCDVFIMG